MVELTVRKMSYSKFRCELLVSSLWNPNLLDLGSTNLNHFPRSHAPASLFSSFPRASVGMPSGRASVPFPQRWRVAHGIPTLARGNEKYPLQFKWRLPYQGGG